MIHYARVVPTRLVCACWEPAVRGACACVGGGDCLGEMRVMRPCVAPGFAGIGRGPWSGVAQRAARSDWRIGPVFNIQVTTTDGLNNNFHLPRAGQPLGLQHSDSPTNEKCALLARPLTPRLGGTRRSLARPTFHFFFVVSVLAAALAPLPALPPRLPGPLLLSSPSETPPLPKPYCWPLSLGRSVGGRNEELWPLASRMREVLVSYLPGPLPPARTQATAYG